MSTWTCSIDYQIPAVSLNGGGNPDPNAYVYGIEFHCVCQPTADPLPPYNEPANVGHYACSIGLDNSGLSFMGLQMQQDSSETGPLFWPSFFGAPLITGQPTLAFTGGGTITMTKDDAGDLFTATSPIGTISFALSSLDPFLAPFPSYKNPTPMVPQGYGAQFTLASPTFAFPEYAVLYEAQFSNIVAQENGVTYKTYPLTAASHDQFYPDNGLAFDPLAGTVFDVFAPFWVNTQEVSDQKLTAQVTVPDFPAYRIFTYWRSLGSMTRGSDMEMAREHGLLWRAAPDTATGNSLLVARSFNNGRDWQPFTAYTDPAAANAWPSLNWFAQKLWLTWHDGANIRQSVSVDGGQNWTMPGTFPYAGTNPRHIIDKECGLGLYFFFSGSDLKVARSFDGGQTFIDGSPLTAVAGIGAQQVDAAFAPDGSIVLTVFVAMAWTHYRSRDFGASWS
jgi:hypothetical protein